MDVCQSPLVTNSASQHHEIKRNRHFKNGPLHWRRRTIGLVDSAAICREFESMKSDLMQLEDAGVCNRKTFSSFKPQHLTIASPIETSFPPKGSPGQDSDVDSGIVAYGKRGDRVGSASSTDTDSSTQDSRKTINFRTFAERKDHTSKSNGIKFCTLKRNANSSASTSARPIKADHSVLKECNRRPPTPLTVFGEPQHCVRFDEQLQLSEQSLRKSCRKLFATLYAQRSSYPSSTENSENGQRTFDRSPDLIAGRHSSRSHTTSDSEAYRRTPNRSRSSEYGTVKSDNWRGCGRKGVTWNLQNPQKFKHQMSTSDIDLYKQQQPEHYTSRLQRASSGKLSLPKSESCSCYRPLFKASTDSGLGGCRSQCTCQHVARNSGGSSSQSSTSSSASFTSSTVPNHCCCCHGCCQPQVSNSQGVLYKSRSCSTIPGMFHQGPDVRTSVPLINTSPTVHTAKLRPTSVALQKTSSYNSLLESSVTLTNVPVYNDSMMHVYAHVAAVVPDSLPMSKDERLSVDHPGTDHGYDTVKYPPVVSSEAMYQPHAGSGSCRTSRRNIASDFDSTRDYASPQNQNSSSNCVTKEFRTNTPSSDLYVTMDSRLVPFRSRNSRENTSYKSVTSYGRPSTMVEMPRPSSATPSAYVKPSLKSHTSLRYVEPESVEATPTQNGKAYAEVEYAVVDKSKKNRFSSLPALNRFSSSVAVIQDDELDQPPVPPKKNLHKSDFCLNKNSSEQMASKKTFLEKWQGITKTAKNAFQRAFSTERIYRPEREERLEASGDKLHRSRSLVRSLRASFNRKKKKRTKPPMAEVVPQANSDPVWNGLPMGPDSPVPVRGQLLQLNLDGSQVVELTKPPNKPHGFFVARGRVRNSRGVFVSRMRDKETQRQLVGLLDIGDEILEIEGLCVKNADIMEVNNLMANKNTLLLTVLPSICRKDI